MHQHFEKIEPDDHFDPGTLAHLVAGNEGRVLDGRRTPGFIESFDQNSGMFIWRITAFEDKGKFWEVPAEEISSYQFRKTSTLLSQGDADAIAEHCKQFQKCLEIRADTSKYEVTERRINEQEVIAEKWLKNHSAFITKNKLLIFAVKTGDEDLYADFAAYMEEMGVLALEKQTAEQYLLNPYSGEWIKGMKITMAEMGLIDYTGTVMRKKDAFSGIGEKSKREHYIIARLAFVRVLFRLKGYHEVPLFRGVSSSVDFFKTPNSLLSATFSSDTAKAFASIDEPDNFRSCYWAKFTCPIENLFMTFLETKQFNERYQEQEAVIFHNPI